MFFGTHHHSIDDKGRISIPKEFRDLIQANMEDRLMVTCYYDGRLRAYLPDQWRKMVADIKDKDPRVQENRDFEMFFIGGAHLCRLDKAGRILLPEELREYAGLKRELTLVGQTHGIDIWDKERFRKIWQRVAKGENERRKFPPASPEPTDVTS